MRKYKGEKHVHSKDPRKIRITDALKRMSGGGRVSLLTEVRIPGIDGGTAEQHIFRGHCSAYDTKTGFWNSLGMFEIEAKDVPGLQEIKLGPIPKSRQFGKALANFSERLKKGQGALVLVLLLGLGCAHATPKAEPTQAAAEVSQGESELQAAFENWERDEQFREMTCRMNAGMGVKQEGCP